MVDAWPGGETILEAGDARALTGVTQSTLILTLVPTKGSFGASRDADPKGERIKTAFVGAPPSR
jgi:hypothetical protein